MAELGPVVHAVLFFPQSVSSLPECEVFFTHLTWLKHTHLPRSYYSKYLYFGSFLQVCE